MPRSSSPYVGMAKFHGLSTQLNRLLLEYRQRNEYPTFRSVTNALGVSMTYFSNPPNTDVLALRRRLIRAQIDWFDRNPDADRPSGGIPTLPPLPKSPSQAMFVEVRWFEYPYHNRICRPAPDVEIPRQSRCPITGEPPVYQWFRQRHGGEWQPWSFVSSRGLAILRDRHAASEEARAS